MSNQRSIFLSMATLVNEQITHTSHRRNNVQPLESKIDRGEFFVDGPERKKMGS